MHFHMNFILKSLIFIFKIILKCMKWGIPLGFIYLFSPNESIDVILTFIGLTFLGYFLIK